MAAERPVVLINRAVVQPEIESCFCLGYRAIPSRESFARASSGPHSIRVFSLGSAQRGEPREKDRVDFNTKVGARSSVAALAAAAGTHARLPATSLARSPNHWARARRPAYRSRVLMSAARGSSTDLFKIRSRRTQA